MIIENMILENIKNMPPSGIRKYFDLINEMEDVISLGVGEPDFVTPWNIIETGIYSLEQGHTHYSSNAGFIELRKEISNYMNRRFTLKYSPEDEILVTVGGSEAIDLALRALVGPGDEVVIPEPSFVAYKGCTTFTGAKAVTIELLQENDFKLTAEALCKAVTNKTKALILNTPNNPTGMVYTDNELRDIADIVINKDFYVVADEMYETLTYDGHKHISIASLGKEIYDRTITCNGLAKSYAMTGWRIGYTGSPLQIARMMGSVQSHQTSNPNSIAQKAAVEALNGPQDSVSQMNEEFNKRRQYVYERICNMPFVSTIKPMGAFYVFVDASEVLGKTHKGETVGTVAKMAEILINEYNTAVVPCADFGFDDHLRLSYAISMEQIEKGLDRIEKFLKELK